MGSRTTADVLPPRYTSVEPLARGGMGEIYEACDDALGRQVAVKVLAEGFAHDPALRARFTREALAAARLSSEAHAVTIYDVGEWNERPYIVMELVRGGTVADRRDRRGISPGETLRWLEGTAAALDAAHALGIVHRDVKPANLLLTSEGEVRVADFGIASAAGLTSLTETGSVLGTFGYLAPEQAAGATVGPAADRYSLAVVAYELLSGRRPFEHETGAAEALAAGREPPPPISSVGPDLPGRLDAVFVRALAKAPGDRYPSCAELVGDVRRAFAEDAAPTAVQPPAPPPPVQVAPVRVATPRPRTNPLPWLAALLLLAGGGVAAALLLTRDNGQKPAPLAAARTVTAQGTTVTVTTPAPTTATRTPPPPPPPPPVSGASGSSLNDVGYRRMQAHDYRAALPLLEKAVARLSGTGSLAEAYASYNLAFTRIVLGSCDGVAALLDRSQAVQGHRSEIDALRRQVQARCG